MKTNRSGVVCKSVIHIPNKKTAKLKCICPVCGSEFEMWQSHFYEGKNYCECQKRKRKAECKKAIQHDPAAEYERIKERVKTLEKIKPYRLRTEKEIQQLKRKQCFKCEYFMTGSKTKIGGTCGYILQNHHRRGCDPFQCKEAGVFKPRTRKRRTKSVTLAGSAERIKND